MRPTFQHHDDQSKLLRALSIMDSHMFICHESNPTLCKDGCDQAANPERVLQLEHAYEEVPE